MNLNTRTRLKIKCRQTAREVVDELDGRERCLSCGSRREIEVHHIDGDCFNNHPMNLAPVCHACHRDAHRMRKAVSRIQEMRSEFESLGN